MEFLDRDRGVSSEGREVKLGVIDVHWCRIGPGTLRSRTLEIGSQIVECRVDRPEVVGKP